MCKLSIQTLSTYVGGANATNGGSWNLSKSFTHGKNAWASNMDSNLNLFHIFVEVVINYQKWEIKSPSLVLANWWNLFRLTLCSKCGFEIGWSNPSDGAKWHSWMEMATWNEDHGGGVDMWWWSSSGLGKEEREKQNGLKAKVYVIGPFCFGDQDTTEIVITFRIDDHTINRGALIGQLDHLVPLGVG